MCLPNVHSSRRLAVLAVLALTGGSSVAQADVLTFTGSTTDWFAPSNWDLGRIPTRGDTVFIVGGRSVIIDPANDPAAASSTGGGAGKVSLQDVHVIDDSVLETLAGTEFTTRNETISLGGQLIHRGTRAIDDPTGGTLRVLPRPTGLDPGDGRGGGGMVLNPTPKSKREVLLQSSVTFGLGGTTAASNLVPDAFGPGHYATIDCLIADLGGTLDLQLFHGFTPALGQSFQIISIGTTRTGTFDGLGEGAFVKSFGDVALYISYAGGDGNDVVLTASAIPAPGAAALLGLGGLMGIRRRR